MAEHIEFDPVDRITIGAVGEPGQRIFMLQAVKEDQTRTWILEKEHVQAIGSGSQALLAQIGEQDATRELLGPGGTAGSAQVFAEAMELEPGEPEYRISPDSMALGYDDVRDLAMLAFSELVPLEEDEEVSAAPDPRTAKLWLTRKQLAALAVHGLAIAARGRPSCPLCGGVMEPGHQCPKFVTNGHTPKQSM